MDSISHPKGKWQPIEYKLIKVYPSGVNIPKRGFAFVPSALSSPSRKNRGNITTFSVKTRQRLRSALLTKSIPDSYRVGVTYTVPWKGENFEPFMDEFREVLHRFRVAFCRKYPRSGFIYRVELQERGAPHLHALTYFAREDLARLCGAGLPAAADARMAAACVQVLVGMLWVSCVTDLHHGSYTKFCKFGVKAEPLKSDGAMMRYICDHTSKRKQAQLGYKGKQWGIIGCKNFVTLAAETLPDFDDERHAVVFFRTLRKVMRYRITDKKHKRKWKRPPPFGSVLKGSRRDVGDFYLSRDSVFKLWNYSRIVPRGTNVKQSV